MIQHKMRLGLHKQFMRVIKTEHQDNFLILTSNTIGVFFRIGGNLESVSTLLVGGKVTNIVDKEGLTTATKKIQERI